jgi:hypothetical protein
MGTRHFNLANLAQEVAVRVPHWVTVKATVIKEDSSDCQAVLAAGPHAGDASNLLANRVSKSVF